MTRKLMVLALALAPIAALAAPGLSTLQIDAFGDSTTAGVISKDRKSSITKASEIGELTQMLQQQYGDRVNIVVKNHGVPGAQAAELLYPHGGDDQSHWEDLMKTSPAKIVLINYAINDARHYFFKDKKVRLESPEEYGRIITRLVEVAKQNHKQVILQEPNPICGKAERWNVWPYVWQLNQVAKQQQVAVVHQYSVIKEDRDWQSQMSDDCIHPLESLYKAKADRTFSIVSPLVQQSLAQQSP
jgi:lysophospholipase L1-like esterase